MPKDSQAPGRCPSCDGAAYLCERYDARYCPACDTWLDGICSAAGTEGCMSGCAERPERPSEVE
jgi:hypothetical protein